MDKKHVLKDISAAELREELIGRLREQVRRNEEENDRLREQIRGLNPQVVVVSTNARARLGRPVTRLARNGMSLREVIAEVLRTAPEPMRVRDIVELVKQAGYVSKAGNFGAMVSISLSQNDELFEKLSRGVYKIRAGAATESANLDDAESQDEGNPDESLAMAE